MNITCNNCEQVLSEYLCNVPSAWRSQIVKVVCKYINSQPSITCQDVKDCETITFLSAFTVTGTQVCITYKDENGAEFERCFDFDDIHNSILDDVDPKCITSQEIWDAMTFTERIQAIIDYACTCEEVTTTTTTSTSTTSTSTTTSTSSTTTTTTTP